MRKIFLAIALSLSFAGSVWAAGVDIIDSAGKAGMDIECPEGVVNCTDSYGTEDAQNFVLQIIGGLLNFVAIIAVVMLIIAGLRLVISLGNQESLQAAKKNVVWTLGGLAIVILALLIVQNITEKVYETTKGCATISVDGLFGPETSAASSETPNLAAKWCKSSWPSDDSIEDDNVGGFQAEYNQLECNTSDFTRVDITQVTTTNCAATTASSSTKTCKTLSTDGLLGPLTDAARQETPNLAAAYTGGSDCISDYQGVSVKNMRVRKSGEPACNAVKEFQSAYNGKDCDTTTGKRKDSAGVSTGL